MDTIEFRPAHAQDLPRGAVSVVEVVINGTALPEMWRASTGIEVENLEAEHVFALWSGNADAVPSHVERGRPAVLTCTCFQFGCGGATAHITFTADTVRWDDFHHANGGDEVALGPFEFNRAQYDAALASTAAFGR